MKALNLSQKVSDYEASKSTDDGEAGKVKSKEVLLAHFLGLAYPNTPATTAPKIER